MEEVDKAQFVQLQAFITAALCFYLDRQGHKDAVQEAKDGVEMLMKICREEGESMRADDKMFAWPEEAT